MNIYAILKKSGTNTIVSDTTIRWNILFPFRNNAEELLEGTGFDTIEQLTYSLIGKKIRYKESFYIELRTASAFTVVLSRILEDTNKYINKEVLEMCNREDASEIIFELTNAYNFFDYFFDFRSINYNVYKDNLFLRIV
jgi:hypothetical protein